MYSIAAIFVSVRGPPRTVADVRTLPALPAFPPGTHCHTLRCGVVRACACFFSRSLLPAVPAIMATSGARPADEAWRKLEPTLAQVLKGDDRINISYDDAMKAMTAVHDYCTATGAGNARTRQGGGYQAQGA
jgi:hypothetical protein